MDGIQLVQSMLFHANVASAIACRSLPTLAGFRVRQTVPWRQYVLRALASRFAGATCVSAALRAQTRSLGIVTDNVRVIPNACRVRCPADVGPRPDVLGAGQTVLFAGRLEFQKGIDRFVALLPSLLRNCPTARAVVAGDGPLRATSEALAASHPHVRDRIVWTGWVGDVRDLMAHADVVVSTSRWEGMSNVILEAMAEGRPVVAPDVEGVRDTLGELTRHQVVGQEDEWIEAVTYWLQHAEQADRQGRRNRERIESAFSPQVMIERYERFFVEVLNARKT